MTHTLIIGSGMIPVGEHWDRGLRDLATEAGQAALTDAGLPTVDAIYIANAYGSTFNQQSQLGSLIADFMSLSGVEAVTIEAGDASGGAALRTAHLAVLSGEIETALVIGVEKATDIVGSARNTARNISLDADYETLHGATLPAMAALLMRRYMYEYGLELSAFEGFSINAHANGKRNPYAMYQNTLREGAFSKAPMIADPVNLFDSAPDGDGAAAVVIASASHPQAEGAVRIAGSAGATDYFTLQDRADMLHLRAVASSVEKALAQAGVTRDDITFFELHDAFTILSALSLEAAGFAERGAGWQLAQDGSLGLQGALPVSTFGGLKSRGNPAGAAGVYQAVEAVMQLQGKAGDNQVADATTAMIQSMANLGSTVYTHILTLESV